MSVVLRIDHTSDVVNQYFTSARTRLVFGGLNGHTVVPCVGADATHARVQRCLSQYAVTHVLGAGHGDPDGFDGSNGQPIWHCDHDLDDARGLTFHLLCCSAAQRLGPRLIARGARAFWGYAALFLFPTDTQPRDPATDRVAAPFLEMAIQVDLGLLAGDASDAILERVARFVERTFNTIPYREERQMFLDNYHALQCLEPGGVTLGP